MKNKSYFSLNGKFNPFKQLDRWRNPFEQSYTCTLDGHDIKIALTERARQALRRLNKPLLVEMQLYFSCMVKKRVLFHTETPDLPSTPTGEHLNIAFRCVQSDSCDPQEFATHYPGKKTLDAVAAIKMHPHLLQIDYKNKRWQGEFTI